MNIKALLDVIKKASSSLDLGFVGDFILKKACKVLDADHSAIFILDESAKNYILFNAYGFKSNEIENIKILGGWEEIVGEVIKKRKPIVVNDIKKNKIFKKKEVRFFKEKLPFNAFIAVPLIAKKKIEALLLVSSSKKRDKKFTQDDSRLLFAFADHVAIALANAKLHKKLKDSFLSTIKALITAVDAKDPYTHGHSERVMKYSMAIAKYLDVTDEFSENLKLSSLLHDVGKIGIKDDILSKKGPLTESERKIIEKHPAIGEKIVSSIMNSENIIDGIKEHHEKFNGKGYPNALDKNNISLEGRTIAVADTYDTLTTDRPYQKAFTPKEAFFEIIASQGTHFDPRAVKAFEESFSKEPEVWNSCKT